jgi:hypothetical protein
MAEDQRSREIVDGLRQRVETSGTFSGGKALLTEQEVKNSVLELIELAIRFDERLRALNGALKFPGLQNDQPTLLGRAVHELSNMDGVIDSGQANAIGLYGDFSNYVVTQRVGTSVELIPHIFGQNLRPTGQRGMLMWGRYGADSINDAAFRMLVA